MWQRLMRSDLVWRASGLTYPTAVAATNSRVRTVSDYLALTRGHMAPLLPYFPQGGTFLEFGSGLGGNLVAVSHLAKAAIGLDVNPGYVRISRRIARQAGVTNVTFQSYDGVNVPQLGPQFDVVFSVGVFERLPHDRVGRYVSRLVSQLGGNGSAILYFLSPQAARTTFARRLGPKAYAPWDREEVLSLLTGCGLAVSSTIPFKPFPLLEGSGSLSVGDFYIGSRKAA